MNKARIRALEKRLRPGRAQEITRCFLCVGVRPNEDGTEPENPHRWTCEEMDVAIERHPKGTLFIKNVDGSISP